jgi:hypothetical protein
MPGRVETTPEVSLIVPKKRPSILEEAQEIIHGPRREKYGHPRKNFQDIADGWSVIFGIEVTPEQVGLAMIWTKVCRETHAHDRDNLVDISGYAGTIEMLGEDE